MFDFSISKYSPTIKTERDRVIQEIDMLFDTYYGEVLGDLYYGTDYEKFLHDLTIGNSTIKNQIESDIYNYVDLGDFTLSVSVDILYGTQGDIILVNINLYNTEYSITKTYKI